MRVHAGVCRAEATALWLTLILPLFSAHHGGKKALVGPYFAW